MSVIVDEPKIPEKIYDMILANRNVDVREIMEAIEILHCSIVSILNKYLVMKKISDRLVRNLFRIEHN